VSVDLLVFRVLGLSLLHFALHCACFCAFLCIFAVYYNRFFTVV